MAEKKDGMNKRTTANEIKKLFYTAVRGNMLFIYDNKTKNLLSHTALSRSDYSRSRSDRDNAVCDRPCT